MKESAVIYTEFLAKGNWNLDPVDFFFFKIALEATRYVGI